MHLPGDSRVTCPGWVPGILTRGSSFTGTGVKAPTAYALTRISDSTIAPKNKVYQLFFFISNPLIIIVLPWQINWSIYKEYAPIKTKAGHSGRFRYWLTASYPNLLSDHLSLTAHRPHY
jgi:hypothetical protein